MSESMVGVRVRARWVVGPAQRGSGWVDAKYVRDDDPVYVIVENRFPGSYMIEWPHGGYASIHDGEFIVVDDEDDDEDECPGHESLAGAHMGQSVFCDGSCVREEGH